MLVLLGIALKSLIIAGLTLAMLAVMKRRSAAERSWIAHIGLIALVMLALAPLVLPSWTVEAPALFAERPAAEASMSSAPVAPAVRPGPVPQDQAIAGSTPAIAIDPAALITSVYAVPAAVLLLLTLLALARLIALRARADVLVDGHWLSALARAQRRMGFKHGTALLTSNELASPISWGLMRPVILLNTRAVEAAGEAEAIIAHELAHVARMDWIKLLLARIATALFWFNPLVWLLAREAHQLREETADDAVLAADIADTDYAELLVGVARHECPGLLLGAHGVAPSRNSLARRVARVLDGETVRGPAARSFAFGIFVGAVMVAAPLAALTLAPAQKDKIKHAAVSDPAAPATPRAIAGPGLPGDLPSIIVAGVSSSVEAAVAAARPGVIDAAAFESALGRSERERERALEAAMRAREVASHQRERALDADARQKRALEHRSKALMASEYLALTPEYVGAIRAVAPQFARLGTDDLAGMHALGVTPAFARDLLRAFPSATANDVRDARAIGMTGSYVMAMRAAGVRGDIKDFVELHAVGVQPNSVERARRAGVDVSDPDGLVELHVLGSGPKPSRPPDLPIGVSIPTPPDDG